MPFIPFGCYFYYRFLKSKISFFCTKWRRQKTDTTDSCDISDGHAVQWGWLHAFGSVATDRGSSCPVCKERNVHQFNFSRFSQAACFKDTFIRYMYVNLSHVLYHNNRESCKWSFSDLLYFNHVISHASLSKNRRSYVFSNKWHVEIISFISNLNTGIVYIDLKNRFIVKFR